MRTLVITAIVASVAIVPASTFAHEYVSQSVCTRTVSSSAPSNDCARVDTDTEFEDGLVVTLDGDDANPRGDGTSDGYIAVHVKRDGVAVSCESDGGFNHDADRPGGDTDDHNGENDPCEP